MTEDAPGAAQDDVLEFLGSPEAYGPEAAEVGHVQTHISEVFFAGDLVYKVKRAVRYSFVDFTTLESRRGACEAEVALNRRTAPDIYLGLAAIRRDPDGRLALDRLDAPAAGEPVEWAVVMRRFDPDLTFDRLAERDALKPEWILQLVDAAVALHQSAEVHGAPFGGAAALARIIAENRTDMAACPEVFAADRAGALGDAMEAVCARHGALLDARREAGFVRRCHGDLHLGNVVLWQGRPTLFDCIEFSDTIAVIDVFYDFAFLVMDLEVRGLRDLANQALNRFVGRTGDVAALAVMPLMLGLRAAVRAKVNALALAGRPADGEARSIAAAAERYLSAAEVFIAPAPAPPRLIAIGGLSGSGKTTVARALAPGLGRAPGALHLRTDYIRKRIAGVLPEHRLPAAAYTPEADREVYETMMEEAGEALRAGQSVIADAVFARPRSRQAIEDVAAREGMPFHGIWLEPPGAVMTARIEGRTSDASDATVEVLARQLDYETGEIGWNRLKNDAGPEAAVHRVQELLEQ
ncbi:MAG: AAA family ATPase [Alphaproteobacteria bacterium]|nr:AAA family ATPase [Alphaproteobacteria bacterium]